ncbi:MAG: glycosyltransferase [Paludibacter sp.]|nr:glycosyltransferase [Paludibacter sp.]
MISIIISTRDSGLLQRISENIHETIGVEYEIIAIENNAQYSICEAYNMGVDKSNYPYLCFVHEDVLFKTNDWGKRLVSVMTADDKIGLIGIAGTKFRSTYPSAIGQGPGLSKFLRGHIYHFDVYKDFDESIQKKELEDVVCIDGVFMFSNKKVFNSCRFDDKLLTHFHGYDIDFSLQVYFNSFRVIVARNVLLAHYSNGNYIGQNTIANRKVGKKWIKKLPVATKDTNLGYMKIRFLDAINWIYFIRTALKRNIRKNNT